MPKNERQRQKKLDRNRSKERQRKRSKVNERQSLASLAGMMNSANRGPIHACCLGRSPRGSEVNGMVSVTLVRGGPQGQLAFANFLVDLWCLGVKNCDGGLITPMECRKMLEDFRQKMELEPIEPPVARAIVEAGVQYAASLGLAPHPDFRKLALLWGEIPLGEIPLGLEIGLRGRPCYIVGPYDDVHKQFRITRTLCDSIGKDNFDVVTAAQQFSGEFLLPSL